MFQSTSVLAAFIVAVILAIIFTVRRCFRTDHISLLLKIAASVGFIFLGTCTAKASGAADYSVIVGLVFGLLGDAFLDMKYVYSEHSDFYTFAGFIAFMCGHAFYIAYLASAYGFRPGAWCTVGIGIIFGVIIYFSGNILGMDYGKFRLISAIYALILVFETAFAILGAFAWNKGNAGSLLFAIGLVLFLGSDLVLSNIYFKEGGNTPAARGINHALYYAAQILIALSLFYVL